MATLTSHRAESASRSGAGAVERTAAAAIAPLVHALLGEDPPIRIALWDGSGLGEATLGTIHVRRPEALRRIAGAPGELGLARAYVSGDLDLEGDIFD
ncbi:MAG TPA: hypothetical protein VJ804_02730, partial [Acidimicrobiales bacterium]|nr:hypothetical protein [Acidimicrobiales bacterium]